METAFDNRRPTSEWTYFLQRLRYCPSLNKGDIRNKIFPIAFNVYVSGVMADVADAPKKKHGLRYFQFLVQANQQNRYRASCVQLLESQVP